jgi:hypothetical protein
MNRLPRPFLLNRNPRSIIYTRKTTHKNNFKSTHDTKLPFPTSTFRVALIEDNINASNVKARFRIGGLVFLSTCFIWSTFSWIMCTQINNRDTPWHIFTGPMYEYFMNMRAIMPSDYRL